MDSFPTVLRNQRKPTAGSLRASGRKVRSPKNSNLGEDSVRRVGKLEVFGIKALHQVAFILPREYHDYSLLKVEFGDLVAGIQASVAGIPHDCRKIKDGSRDQEATQIIEDDEDDEEAHDAYANVPAVPNGDTYRFMLRDVTRRKELAVEVTTRTAMDRKIIETACAGNVLYLYGTIKKHADCIVLKDPELISDQERGRICASYPSKSKTTWRTVKIKHRKNASGKKAKPGSREVRESQSLPAYIVSSLIQSRLRLGIPTSTKYLRERMNLLNCASEWSLLRKIGSPDLTFEGLLWQAHLPRSREGGEAAKTALDRLVAIEYMQQVFRERETRRNPDSVIRFRKGVYQDVKDELLHNSKMVLTPEQDAAAKEILIDLRSDLAMYRTLSGDVGTGKTLVFGAVAATVAAGGGLVVIIEPRTLLAHQVYAKLSKYWPSTPIQIIVGDTIEREPLSSGIIVGTTAVWTALQTSLHDVSLIVADEQHKYAVKQRCPFTNAPTNLLEVTATPIPRTQGLLEFGGMEISELRSSHVSKTLHTELITSRDEIFLCYDHVCQQIRNQGSNLAVIYTRVEDAGEADEVTTSVIEAAKFWEERFPGRVAVIHGRMSEDEKLSALRRFEMGEADIILGTIVLEVGIDLPRLDQIIIHHPERLGVASTHQLRGRLARRGGEGWCYLVCPDPISPPQFELYKHMEIEHDGFKLAYLDMLRRGFGDMRSLSLQQHGAYEGFLVDRPPTLENIQFALQECREWVGEYLLDLDMFDRPVIESAFLNATKKQRTRKNSDSSSSGGPTLEQLTLI